MFIRNLILAIKIICRILLIHSVSSSFYIFSYILTSKGKRKMSSEDVESRESLLDGQPNGHAKVVIERPVFSQQKFDEGFSPGSRPQTTLRESFLKSCRKCQCSKDCFLGFLYKIMPFIGIMKDYNIRTDLTGDIVSGLTVGIMHIPQGEAVWQWQRLKREIERLYNINIIMNFFFLLNWDFDKNVAMILELQKITQDIYCSICYNYKITWRHFSLFKNFLKFLFDFDLIRTETVWGFTYSWFNTGIIHVVHM